MIAKEAALTHADATRLLSYERDTGRLRWQVSRGPAGVGSVAGTTDPQGYVRIFVFGRQYLAHRIAWFIAHGQWPAEQLDHRNGDPSDNRLANLRECSNAENAQNRGIQANSTTGAVGVSFHQASGRFRAYIKLGGRQRHLGLFECEQDAAAAYEKAKRDQHTFQPEIRA